MKIRDNIHVLNVGLVTEIHERFQRDPDSVDAATRAFFEEWIPPEETALSRAGATGPDRTKLIAKAAGTVNLARMIRRYGHLAANLDPLGDPPPGDPALSITPHGLTDEDLRQLPASLVGGPLAERSVNALVAIDNLRQVYSAGTGYDLDHIHQPEERQWLRHAAESGRFRYPHALIDFKALLVRLTQVEVFERFLHRVFPGKTRFSIEGLDMMVPMLDEIIGFAADAQICHMLIGMAHRGRLNVLAHLLKKPYAQILAEFKDPLQTDGHLEALGWTGDVKYHMGASRLMPGHEQVSLMISVAPNPSHLESVDPVVAGMARAAGTDGGHPGPPHFGHLACLPILIHGDAAFPGQGVVAETLNLSRLPGYQTGGAIHLIANNQLGFTTPPESGRGTTYASDLAKGFEIPIVHVNADDPKACIEAARMAFAYRARFQKDFLIDLIGYRRHGHNEGDEPDYTQPRMVRVIASHPTVRALWARKLAEQKVIVPDWPAELERKQFTELQGLMESLKPEENLAQPDLKPPLSAAARQIETAVSEARLRALSQGLRRLPDGFTLHPKLKGLMDRRVTALEKSPEKPEEPSIDWAMAEELALASILEDGIAIRLTGQDTGRGTFSHRHAVLSDPETGKTRVPLQNLPQARAAFEIVNSPLSENAALGFEYGYNIQAPGRLVIWEAQYGDFINGAQVMIDEFIASARAKWGQNPSLVLLLPHGYEGQGPDHSSARLERFLDLAADVNMRVAICTTAAQYFHLLRRQALLLETCPLPLIVMTPKSLLRHPRVASTPRGLSEGQWQPVLDDAQARQDPGRVRRLILCSGKICLDLIGSEARDASPQVAIARLEQICPFPAAELRAILEGYPTLEEVVWVQEEPENMGAWPFVALHLPELIMGRWPLRFMGRPRSSSPAEGSAARHVLNQRALIERAFSPIGLTGKEKNHAGGNNSVGG